MKATDDPPSLSYIADKTTREWIYVWLKDPQAYATTATMPNFKLSDDDARDISAFLIANSTPVPSDAIALSAKAFARSHGRRQSYMENPSAPPATRCKMLPAIWWVVTSARS